MKIPPLIYFLLTAPLVSIQAQNGFTAQGNVLTAASEQVNWNQASIGIGFNFAKNKAVAFENSLSYTHANATYDNRYTNWQNNQNGFNEIKNTIEATLKFSAKTAVKANILPSLSFQEKIGIDNVSILGGLELHQIIGSNLVLMAGVSRSSFLGSPKMVPIGAVAYQVNEQINVKVGYPNSVISYSNNERNQFRLWNSFTGNFYNVDSEKYAEENTQRLSISQISTALEYERNIDNNWIINLRGGYDSNRKYQLIQNNGTVVSDLNVGNGPCFSFGIKYKH
ncbi:DUF6268 family outer membrane beta-barrel protein [Flavobacterium agrisoli]|uniref:DUF6268 domain-containing protein n=1 Tax=Flavobacterium agrisoli TaxID=2793066 RepID=A0A934PMK6_9FLAO|nr:DUF6268 family outer membrane beta-barrel protein [Flavobacterium agrisoli]MBK0370282.1 hypothetical protein [Flavobacterium agrisoli]